MNTPTRRAFLGFARREVATAAIGAIGARFFEAAEAMPIAPDPGEIGKLKNRKIVAPRHPGAMGTTISRLGTTASQLGPTTTGSPQAALGLLVASRASPLRLAMALDLAVSADGTASPFEAIC